MLVDGTLALVNYYANGKITYIFSIKGLVLPAKVYSHLLPQTQNIHNKQTNW